MQDFEDENSIKAYLLGKITDEGEITRLEQKLLADDDFCEQLQIIEEELVDDYLDRNLSAEDTAQFESYFMRAPERQQNLEFSRRLRGRLAERTRPAEAEAPRRSFRFFKFPAFTSPFAYAALALFLAGAAGLAIWINPFRSEADKGLAELRDSYKTARPFESRLSGFDYAPIGSARGDDKTDNEIKVKRDRAASKVFNAANDAPNAKSLYALAVYYLTEKQFDKSVSQFDAALKLAPNDARLNNDYGAALMEMAKTAPPDDTNGKRTESMGQALEQFQKALELNDPATAQTALFNKALALQRLNLPEQAKKSWREYLEKDPASPWADEARKNLQSLESKTTSKIPTAATLEQAFVAAFQRRDDTEALNLVGQNRELISGKYLPQYFAMAFVFASDDAGRAEKLALLKYLGALEKGRIKDSYASDLADFYAQAASSRERMAILKEAQTAVKNAYQACLEKDDFAGARAEFERARDLFRRAGDHIEADTICLHFIAYCFFSTDRIAEAEELFKQVDETCRRRNYRWLGLLNGYWLMGAQENTGSKTLAETSRNLEIALEETRSVGDVYLMNKFLRQLASASHSVRRENRALGYIQQLLEFTSEANISERQKFRNLDLTVNALASGNLNGLTEAVALESVTMTEAMTDPLFTIGSEINAGVVYTGTGNYAEAAKWLTVAEEAARRLPDESQRSQQMANIFLKFGHLERKKGAIVEAAGYYEQSSDLSKKMNFPVSLYEAKKSALLAYQSLGRDTEVEKNLGETLDLAEKYRREISDQEERNSFFNEEQSVFDIAVEHKVRQNENEQAYDYAETSNSRSLLDLMLKGEKISVDKKRATVVFDESAKPAGLAEIRRTMPPNVQILQYTVLEKRILLWVISKETFSIVSSETSAADLNQNIENYLSALQSTDGKKMPNENLDTAARELYRILIEPALPQLDRGKSLCLIPNKKLFNLPFAALRSADGKYFLENFDFFYAPSANAFTYSTQAARQKTTDAADEKILSIGNPAFDSRKFPALPDLPDSQTEAENVARNYSQATVLTGKEATRAAFQAAYENYEVIHFASHYVVEPDFPLLSKLMMAKNPAAGDDEQNSGYLTNLELIGKKLPQAKLVVLSACQTGVEGYYNGEGSIGLSRTFLAAGVPLVVASQWQVDSAATAELMEKFHQFRRQKSLSTTRALRQAQLEMIYSAGSRYQSPYFWAAFAAFGGYADF